MGNRVAFKTAQFWPISSSFLKTTRRGANGFLSRSIEKDSSSGCRRFAVKMAKQLSRKAASEPYLGARARVRGESGRLFRSRVCETREKKDRQTNL
jgi:hypothetical protein